MEEPGLKDTTLESSGRIVPDSAVQISPQGAAQNSPEIAQTSREGAAQNSLEIAVQTSPEGAAQASPGSALQITTQDLHSREEGGANDQGEEDEVGEEDQLDAASEHERQVAKSRAERAWGEFKSMVYARCQMDNSIFAGPGHARLAASLGNFRLFETVRQSAPVFSSLLKLNLLFFALVVFFFTFQVASSDRGISTSLLEFKAVAKLLPCVIVATVVLAMLAGILWLSQRPKRLKVFPNMLVLRTEINAHFFSELIIPWQTVESVELTNVKFIASQEVDTRVEIVTSLGVKHWVSLDDLLVDNSEASFINAVRTWAPWAARHLTFSRAPGLRPADKGARLTELWLHQFDTTEKRKLSGMLAAGDELNEEGANGMVLRNYKVLGIIGGGGQGNTYLASMTANDPSPAANDPSPAANDPSPAANDPSPAANDPSPAANDPSPAANDPSPAANDPSPTANAPSPTANASSPTANASSPAANDPSPTANDPSVTLNNPSLTVHDPAGPATEVVLKEYIMPVYRGSAVLDQLGAKLSEEANLLGRLDHPLVVKVLHHFTSDYRGYLVLEYVEGRSLKELVTREGPQPESFVIEVGLSLLSVLKYMHSFNPPIVHRDLTPDNIMLSSSGEIKVVDFNVARQLEGSAGATVVGKHAYIPPEQFRGRPAPASDIYALGCTLYFLLTGEDPEPLSVSHPQEINPRISNGLNAVIARATSLDLGERFTGAGEMEPSLSSIPT